MKLVVGSLLFMVVTAAAQPADVPALIKLVENQPADMDRSTWKDKRRDAVRKLGQSKDKRAVPALVKLADGETFDIVGEIAIEALGNLGDASAVPALQKIANDNARDKAQRDLAKKSLAKLGATADVKAPPPPTPPPDVPIGTGDLGDTKPTPPPVKPTTTAAAAAGDSLLDGNKSAPEVTLPALPDDTLAAYERVTFALGTASTEYDTARKRLSFDFDVAGSFAKRVERQGMAWGWDAGAHVIAGVINPEGRGQVRGTQVDVTGGAEARFYGGKFYGVGKAVLGIEMNYFSLKDGGDPSGASDDSNTHTYADLQIALGGGYGRLLDVGGAIRVRRLSRTLDAAHALGKPIDAATAKQLQLTWWAMRGERSTYPALVATVAILRKAGVMLTEPDVGLAYELLAVLRDSQLYLRPSGLDLQVTVSEGYLRRPPSDNPDVPDAGEDGRVEQLLASAGYGAQLDDDTFEVSGAGYARLRVLAPDGQPSPWAVGASARMRRFTYGEHGDPFGALDLTGAIELAKTDASFQNPMAENDLGLRISGQLGFTWLPNQASGLRLAATVTADGSELFVGAQLSASYGFLDGTFAGL